jgi:hypothetical protein
VQAHIVPVPAMLTGGKWQASAEPSKPKED